MNFIYSAVLTVINKTTKRVHTGERIFNPDDLYVVFFGENGKGMETLSLNAGIKRLLDAQPRMTVMVPEWAKSMQFRTVKSHTKNVAASSDMVLVDISRDLAYSLTGPYVDQKRRELFIHASETV